MNVSITTTHKEGLEVDARSMPGNPYNGHMLAEALEQVAIFSDVNRKSLSSTVAIKALRSTA